jgi:hypothetical protein
MMPDANGNRIKLGAFYNRTLGMPGDWMAMSFRASNVDSGAQHSRNQILNGIFQHYGFR